MDLAIRVEGLGKQYTLGRTSGNETLRETLANATSRIGSLVRGGSGEPARERIWALRDVSFEIRAGQVVGIIGANGAGKSTLLKLLSRITEPTVGRATIAGRVGSLLEVGTGFHPELTGRENIYLNGAILGMRRADIRQRFDEIVEFAEVTRFLDTAVKHYSDGMYLRLAFAVAAHLEPDILLVDEVLAVGDARFQRKCLGKMAEIADRDGRTVLVVSHSMGTIQRLCDHSILIEAGRLAEMGPTPAIVARYLSDATTAGPGQWIDVSAAPRRGTGEARFRRVRYSSGVEQAGFQPYPDGPLEFTFEIEADEPRTVPSFGVVFADRNGAKLVNADILAEGETLQLEPGLNRVRLSIEALHLNAGVYQVTLWMGDTVGAGFDLVEPAFDVDVVAFESAGFGVTPGSEYGSVTCHVSVEQL
ncbi:MAG TPA: polysaccharide ABC transporter ATP-binding protein [Candidatus Eisenbacteria bacterium]|nr:polysaccharide ABC transporter ATP-binding protein [Candidatus Eisenbacteria bacterium]